MAIMLTETEFEVAWEAMRLGDLPLIFRVCVSRRGQTDEERARIVEDTLTGLRQRRLAGPRGLDGELADALMLLANPRYVVDARLEIGRPVRAYGVAGRGDAAVVATLDGGTVTITGSSRFKLPAAVVALAGELPSGPGRSINVPVDALMAASRRSGGDSHLLGDELIESGVPVGDARTIAKLNEEMFGSGQFGIEVIDAEGVPRRGPRVVGFADSPEGRWAQLRTTGNGGREWVTFVPASPARLVAMITEVLTESGVRAA